MPLPTRRGAGQEVLPNEMYSLQTLELTNNPEVLCLPSRQGDWQYDLSVSLQALPVLKCYIEGR